MRREEGPRWIYGDEGSTGKSFAVKRIIKKKWCRMKLGCLKKKIKT